jgi:hypothetical protein
MNGRCRVADVRRALPDRCLMAKTFSPARSRSGLGVTGDIERPQLATGICCPPDSKSAVEHQDGRTYVEKDRIMSDKRILIVAQRTAAAPKLLAAVAARAARGPCRFTLLVPRPYWDPDTEEAAITLELAIPLLDAAAGSHVQGIVGATDPYEAVRQTLEREKYDEVIVSTLPARVSRWLHLDLAHRIEAFGVPVSVVTAEQAERNLSPGAGTG